MNLKNIEMLLEIPKGEKNKYEYDWKNKKLILDRVSFLPMPVNYGFIPETLAEDGDELDVLCLGKKAVAGCFVWIKIIGILKMVDTGEQDNKLIAVNSCDEKWNKINELNEVDQEIIEKISFFFENNHKHKQLSSRKKKEIILQGWGSAKEAMAALTKGKKNFLIFQKKKEELPKEELVKLLKEKKDIQKNK